MWPDRHSTSSPCTPTGPGCNASFFDLMKDELLTFHRQDEVTTAEYARTQRAAEFQEGKINPFILDTTLVSRILLHRRQHR